MATSRTATQTPIGGTRPTLEHYRQLERDYGALYCWTQELYTQTVQQRAMILDLQEQLETWRASYWRLVTEGAEPLPHLMLVRPEGA